MAPSIDRRVSVVALWALTAAAMAVVAYKEGVAKGSRCAADDGHSCSSAGGGRGERKGNGGTIIDSKGGENEDVERVLSLWFDGSSRDNHRTKWFAQVWFGTVCNFYFVGVRPPGVWSHIAATNAA